MFRAQKIDSEDLWDRCVSRECDGKEYEDLKYQELMHLICDLKSINLTGARARKEASERKAIRC